MSGECKTNGKNNYPCALTDKAVSNKSIVNNQKLLFMATRIK